MTEALKPCPFCGVMPEAHALKNGNGGIVQCVVPSCPAAPQVIGADKADAIAAWNTRALTGGVTQADVGVTALVEAGNTLLRVGDDKLATRREWFEAVSGWRDTLAMLRVSQDGGGGTERQRNCLIYTNSLI